jgi:hypothetical protein
MLRGRQATCNVAFVTKKLLKCTGKAAWITYTTFLITMIPLIIGMDCEQQLNKLELHQLGVFETPSLAVEGGSIILHDGRLWGSDKIGARRWWGSGGAKGETVVGGEVRQLEDAKVVVM